ncbi:MAG: class I SAM-dependent methyltransferase [Armatimonadetes bacterium]|nr:class I SAM-dependent methyltransferase [Armatimonadota bacterium]
MKTLHHIPCTQLWKGEQSVLTELARRVPSGGTIVEIGTAEGGTALLMDQATEGLNVKIFTIDIAPSPGASRNLENTGVKSITGASADFARTWRNTPNLPIDMLHIDGGHTLADVCADFNSWASFVNPGGLVVFHDYDPMERGGLAHFAVKICVDTVLRLGTLKDVRQQYRFIYGTTNGPVRSSLTARDCCVTLSQLADRIAGIREMDCSRACFVADDRFAFLLAGIFRAGEDVEIASPHEAADPEREYVVCPHPNGLPVEILRDRGIPDGKTTIIDSLTACYLLAHALEVNYPYLYEHTSSRNEFIYWAEVVSMFNHAFGSRRFPDNFLNPPVNMSLEELSSFVAGEQVRLSLLSRLLKTFVEWTP